MPLRNNRTITGFAIAWIAVCFVLYFQRQPVPFDSTLLNLIPPLRTFEVGMIVRSVGIFARLLLFWCAAVGGGDLITRRFAPKGLPLAQYSLLCLGLGTGGLALSGLGMGLLGLTRPKLMTAVLIAFALYGILAIIREIGARTWTRRSLPPGCAFPGTILAAFGFFSGLIALAPVTFYDSLTYHLALPALALQRGGITPTPLNAFSGIPGNIEMLYLWILPLGAGGVPSQMIHWCLGLLTAAAITTIVAEITSLPVGLWAAAIFVTNPMVLTAASKPGVEMGSSFYLALTLLCLLQLARSNEGRWLILASLTAGIELGTKYQVAVLLPAGVALLTTSRGVRRGLKEGIWFCLIAAALASPWYLKNTFFYKNPVYPLLDGSIFGSTGVIDVAGFVAGSEPLGPRKILGSWEGFKAFIVQPFLSSLPSISTPKDNTYSLAYLLLIPFALLTQSAATLLPLGMFFLALWVPMSVASMIGRFNIPSLVPLSILVALPLSEFHGRRSVRFAAALTFLLNGLFTYAYGGIEAIWPSLQSESAASEFLSHDRNAYPATPYPVQKWANENLPADAKVIFMGDARTFYLARDSEAATIYAQDPISIHANASASGDELRDRLDKAGITHLLINVAEFARVNRQMKFTPQGWAAFRDFWRYVEAIHTDYNNVKGDARSCVIYRFLNRDEAKRPHAVPPFPFGVAP